MNVLRRVVAFLVLPFIGYLIAATIFNHFFDKIEPGDLNSARLVAVAKSCERHGPVAWRGFGYYYKCEADVRVRSDGSSHTSTITAWLSPEHIGKEYAIHTARRGKSLDPDERPQIFLGWLCTFVFVIVYLLLSVWIAARVLPDRGPRKRRMPKRYEPPTGAGG